VKRGLLLSFTMIVLASLQVCADEDCSHFMVLDKYSSSSNYTVYEKTKDAICKDSVNDRSTAINTAAAAGIPLPVLDDIFALNLNGSLAANDWSHWKENFCQSNYNEQYINLQNSNLSEIFSNNAEKAVETCLNREPVYAYFDVPPNGDSFTFTFHVQGREKLKSGEVKPSQAVKNCDPDNPFGLPWYYQHLGDLDISGEKKAFACSWDSTKNAQVEIRLANQGDRAYTLPAIIKRVVPPPPPPPPTWHTEDKNGQPYIEYWQHDPNCGGQRGLVSVSATHRCQIQDTQIHVNGDATGYGTWNLFMDAPAGSQVYEVGCTPTGEHEINATGIPEGSTGLCTGLINGGDADIRMFIKWKERW